MEVNFVKRNESMQKLDYQEIKIGDGLNWFLLCSITSNGWSMFDVGFFCWFCEMVYLLLSFFLRSFSPDYKRSSFDGQFGDKLSVFNDLYQQVLWSDN